MLTINPARAVHADDQIGSLEEGKKADILVIREVEEGQRTYPVITATLVDGRVVSRMWYPALPSMSARFATDAATIAETADHVPARMIDADADADAMAAAEADRAAAADLDEWEGK